jgi:hypothetical protein
VTHLVPFVLCFSVSLFISVVSVTSADSHGV